MVRGGNAEKPRPGPLEYYNTASQGVYRDSTGHQDTPLRALRARWRIYLFAVFLFFANRDLEGVL